MRSRMTTETHSRAIDDSPAGPFGSAGWNDVLAGLIEAVGAPAFGERLMAAIGSVVPVDSGLIIAYRTHEQPLVLYDDLSHDWRENRVERYVDGPYLLDPFYHAAMEGVAPGLYRLRDLAPDRFQQSEYFRSYYVQSHLEDELSYLFPAASNGDDAAVLSICFGRRSGQPRYGKRDRARLSRIAPVVGSLAVRHWRSLHRAVPSSSGLDDALQGAFAHFGRSRLTPRECQVVQLLLRGHSSRSVAERLNITPGTVKIHRNNIYKKLDISSQSELFYLFLDALGAAGGAPGEDPLTRYM